MTVVMTPVPAPSTALATLADTARSYAEGAKAPATLRAYRSDWRTFTAWCADRRLESLPAAPETVALYLADRAGVLAVATMQRHLTSISQAHQGAGLNSPTTDATVRTVWRGIRRTFGVASAKKQALETADIRAMVGTLGDRLIDVRDRAMVLIAFAGALRRSEVAALDVDDVEVTGDGLVVTIRRSKADQEGKGARLGLPYGSDPATCPVRAYLAWLDASGITEGAVFVQVDRHGRLLGGRISGRAVAERIKHLAGRVGHDPDRIGGHSTRRGFITSAVRAQVHERVIMRHSRHRSLPVFRGYVEEAGVFQENAAMAVGL